MKRYAVRLVIFRDAEDEQDAENQVADKLDSLGLVGMHEEDGRDYSIIGASPLELS